MFKQIFIIGLFVLLGQTEANCTHDKLLDMKADSFVSQIWSESFIPLEDIRNSLRFLRDLESVDKKYSDEQGFTQLCQKIETDSQNPLSLGLVNKNKTFLKFAKDCQAIFNDGDLPTKVSLHLLLEQVQNLYSRDVRKALNSKEREAKAPRLDTDPAEEERVFQMFVHADNDFTNKSPSGVKVK